MPAPVSKVVKIKFIINNHKNINKTEKGFYCFSKNLENLQLLRRISTISNSVKRTIKTRTKSSSISRVIITNRKSDNSLRYFPRNLINKSNRKCSCGENNNKNKNNNNNCGEIIKNCEIIKSYYCNLSLRTNYQRNSNNHRRKIFLIHKTERDK